MKIGVDTIQTTEEPLSEKEKSRIRLAIQANMKPEDRHPDEIIKEDYGGDESTYLAAMKRWLEI